MPEARGPRGLEDDEAPEEFSKMANGVRFNFVSGGPGNVGNLYILCGDALDEPLTLIREGSALVVAQATVPTVCGLLPRAEIAAIASS